jgi:hypothetical protein
MVRTKVWLGGKLLDFAEALPEAKRGPIHHLQMVRSFQRRYANEPNRDPRAPPNNRIALSSMRLIEAYSIENFDRLRLAIQRLFPDLPRDPTRSNLLTELDQSVRSLNAGAWWNVGLLLREKGRHFLGLPVRELPELPAQVEMIHVRAHHILPSIATLSFDVRISDGASADLNRIQARSYLPEIEFRSIFRWQSGHRELSVEWVRLRHVREWVDGLRSQVEESLMAYVPPGLFHGVVPDRPTLPAIEVYLLRAGDAALSDEWEKQARWWLESYGIESAFDVYRSDLALFQWPRVERHRRPISGHLLTVSCEKYLAKIAHPQAYSGEKNAILHHVEDELHELLPTVVILQLLWYTRKTIEELRERVFRRIDVGARRLRFKPPTLPGRLHADLLGQSMLLSRLKAEFSREEERISYRMNSWDQLKLIPRTSDKDRGLCGSTVEWIHHELELMQEHLRLARDAFAEHFTVRNTRAIFILTMAVVGLTVVQVVTNETVAAWLRSAWTVAKDALVWWH